MEQNKKKYIPMTETAFYMLLALKEPLHGYGILKYVLELTKGRIKLGPGTIYGTLSKMQIDKLIIVSNDLEKKTIYSITEFGKEILDLEIDRIAKMHMDALSLGGR